MTLSSQALLDLGREQHRAGDPLAARDSLLRAVMADTQNIDAVYFLSMVSLQLGDSAQALPLLEHVAKVARHEADVWFYLGQARAGCGKPSEAAFAFWRSLAISPGRVHVQEALDAVILQAGGLQGLDYQVPDDNQLAGLATIYKEIFGFKTDGRFLEIGAYDGEICSNTCFLADIGWAGVYVEPIKEYAEACTNRHFFNRALTLNTAIAASDGTASISVASVLTSLAPHHVEKFKQFEWSEGYHKDEWRTIKTMSPDTLFSLIKPDDWDLFVLDVEGFEVVVMNALDLTRFRPRVAIIETRDQQPQFGDEIVAESLAVMAKMQMHGYDIHWRDVGNIVFRRRD
jgi:tetratricopeptide (TPR) repeat protein